MSDVSWDTSELDALETAFTGAQISTVPKTAAVVAKGALNIKTEAARFASGIRHAPAYPRSITFDLGTNGLSAEIGPDKGRRQGALGNILEYGTSKNPPLAHLGPAFDREVPRFVTAIEAVAGGLL